MPDIGCLVKEILEKSRMAIQPSEIETAIKAINENGFAGIDIELWQHVKAVIKSARQAEVLRKYMGLIACRPIGGKTEDYFCASSLQQLAKEALAEVEGLK
jgi:hypothetical protein